MKWLRMMALMVAVLGVGFASPARANRAVGRTGVKMLKKAGEAIGTALGKAYEAKETIDTNTRQQEVNLRKQKQDKKRQEQAYRNR